MRFNQVATIQPEYSREDFLRQVLVELGTNADTPIDAVDVEFGEVRESVREIILCTAKVEGECTASVGYDSQEPYIDYEDYKEKVGNTYVTRQRPVTKYRTVTNWHPFTEHYTGEAGCTVYNSDAYEDEDSNRIGRVMKAIDQESINVEGSATLSSKALDEALAECKSLVRAAEVKLPGHRAKDKRYNDQATVKEIYCFKMPYYEVTYTHKGKQYEAGGFASGDFCVEAEFPPNDVDITALVKAKTAGKAATQGFWWFMFAASFVLATALCFLKFAWLCPLPLVMLIIAQASSKAYRKAYTKCSDELSGDVMGSKVAALKVALDAHGFDPLDEDECDDLDYCTVPGAAAPADLGLRLFISWALTVILVIASVVVGRDAYQSELHSPENVDIQIVEKTQQFEPSAVYYINGRYIIELDYQIESEKLGVEYIEMKVHVSDKKGNELGTVRATLSNLEIEKGEKAIIKASWEENNLNENEFFAKLYDMNLEDLKFEYEIGSIQFSDGKYYRNKDFQ